MRRPPGRVKRKLAATLQREFPTLGPLPVLWLPENLHDVKGSWRTGNHDVYRWTGWAIFADTRNTATVFDSFCTMTDCAKAQAFDVYDNEISPATPEDIV